MKITKSLVTDLSYEVIGAAIAVHKEIGPGLLESVYHECLKSELEDRGLNYKSELIIPVIYKGRNLDAKLRCDLLVEELLVVELKSVESVLHVHSAQLITYLKLLQYHERGSEKSCYRPFPYITRLTIKVKYFLVM